MAEDAAVKEEAFSEDYQAFAGVWARLRAGVIDLSILIFPYVVVLVMFALWILPEDAEGIPKEYAAPLMLVNIFFRMVVPVLYFTFSVGRGGMTIGKSLVNVKVVQEDGSPVDYKTACLRYLFIVVLANAGVVIFQLNFIGWALLTASAAMAFFDRKKRMAHDRIFGTVVLAKTAAQASAV